MGSEHRGANTRGGGSPLAIGMLAWGGYSVHGMCFGLSLETGMVIISSAISTALCPYAASQPVLP